MCKCTFSGPTYTQIYLMTGVVTVISAFPVAAASLFSFLDPFTQYTRNIEIAILGSLSFLLIFIGGFVGLQGTCDGKQRCINAMIVMKILATLFLFSLSGAILRIKDIYVPNDSIQASCPDRYAKIADVVAAADFGQMLCTPACKCRYNGVQSIGADISGAGGLDLNSGVTTAQDCSNWKTEYDVALPLLAALEDTYNCRGFCADPTHEIKFFTEINDRPGAYQCHGFYDLYVNHTSLSLSLQYLSGALLQVLTLIYLPCIESESDKKKQAPQPHFIEDLPIHYKKGAIA